MWLTDGNHPTVRAGMWSAGRLGPTVDHALTARTIKTNRQPVVVAAEPVYPRPSFESPTAFKVPPLPSLKRQLNFDNVGRQPRWPCCGPGGGKMWFVYENTQRRKSGECKTNPRRPMGGCGWRLECGSTNQIGLHMSPLWLSVCWLVVLLSVLSPWCGSGMNVVQIWCTLITL